jgi:hypothetical protein
VAVAVAPQAAAAPLSDALRARRPAGGEWFGVYLVDKKVGWYFTDLALVPGKSTQARYVAELVFKAKAGQASVDRQHREERVYESRPGGRLLSFVFEDKGDGGTQTLLGKATQGSSEHRTVNGVSVTLRRATTISEKDKVPGVAAVTTQGAILETVFGGNSAFRAEPKSVAQRLDRVEIFGLARLVLPKPMPDGAIGVPGEMTLVLEGLGPDFRRSPERQSYRTLGGDRTEVHILAAPPEVSQLGTRPLKAPHGEDYLKATLAVESEAPEIVAKAREIAGAETDAYAAAKKVVAWVGAHMKKEYGASADRATDVLRQMRGDCTEHALLSVALLRALGIPARRVDGVVYVTSGDSVPALYWHEWVEAYVGSVWTQLDPTLGQSVADATHLALGEESQADIMTLLGRLKVLDVHSTR